jgi:transposase
MKRIDARTLSREAKAEKRRTAIRLLIKGLSRQEVAEVTEVHPGTVGKWERAWKEKGEALFEVNLDFGGSEPLVSAEDQVWLVETIKKGSPKEFGYDSPLWNLSIARDLLLRERKVEASVATVFRFLRRHGLRPRVPQR